MLSQDAARRIDFTLANLNRIYERLDEIEDSMLVLEYAISLLSKRIDDLER